MIRSSNASGFCVGYPSRSRACELMGGMSVQILLSTVPLISSRYRLSRGRLDLLFGYQMRPSESSRAIVSWENRQPLGGGACPLHS